MAHLGDTKIVSLTLLDGVIGDLNPKVTTTYNLGTSSLKWNNIYATTLNGSLAASNITGTLGIDHGGTGATAAAGARANLGTWALVSDTYPTIMPADGSTNNWIKIGKSNSSYGLLPSTSGSAGSGHNYIGTSSWYWKYAYIDEIYGHLNGNADSATEFSATTTVALTGDATGTSAASKKGWSVPVTLANSGVTANTYGDTSQQTPSHGGTFNIPYFTVDAKGRLTSAGTTTVKLPSDNNTDTLVKQTAKTDSVEYKILTTVSASPTSGNAAEAGYGANLAYNPSLNRLSTGNIALTGNLNVTGNAILSNETNITSATIGSLQVNGNANFIQIPTAPTPASTSNDTSLATTEFVKTSVAGLSGAMHFKGTTTTAMSDGLTTAAVTINGSSYTPSAGDVVIYSDSEYVWTGSAWERFGRDGSWKTTQAAVDSGTAITNKWVSRIQQNANGEITATMATLDTSGTWSGTATTATKLSNTAKIGDTNKPVYFTASGVPAAISYTIDKSVPSNAVFTDRYVNSASFEHDTTNNNIKMTLTRAGSDTATVTANIPAASSASSGVVTTETQTFAGNKTFNGNVNLSGETEADSLTAGNLQVNGSATFVNTINGNVTSASTISATGGTAAKFWRGDNTWSDTISGGTLKITNNSNTVTIGSQNASYCHIYNTASIPFIFNNTITTTSGNLGSSSYRWGKLYVGTADSYGTTNKPIYWNAGIPAAVSDNSVLVNLGSTTGASIYAASPRPGVTGTLGAANGGTGKTSLIDASNALLNALSTGSSTPVDTDYYISQYVNGGTITTTYHRRPMSALWEYIKGKITNGIYWANVKTTSTATYKAQPEVASVKVNGKTASGDADSASTKNVQFVYDASLEVLNFIFS